MWNEQLSESASTKASLVIDKLLDKNLVFNTDEYGVLVNQLSDLMYQGASLEVLYDFFNKSKNITHYMALAFIIEESWFVKNKRIYPLIKKLINLNYYRVTSGLIFNYAINITSKEDLNYLYLLLSNQHLVIRVRTMYAVSYIIDDETYQKFIDFSDELRKIQKKKLDIRMKCIPNTSKLLEILIFCNFVRSKSLNKKELLVLANRASCDEILEFYYFYVLDHKDD